MSPLDSLSGIFARIVALIGYTALLSRRVRNGAPEPAWGNAPAIPPARPQGNIPTLKMPTARGWTEGQTPIAAPGLKVNAFATGLTHPRWIQVLPNGDVLVAESINEPRAVMRTIFDYAMVSTMKRARAVGVSANRIMRFRDADGDGVAETREVFLDGLNQPFGMALVGDTFYVGNTDGVVAFPYVAGASRITAPGRTLAAFKPGGTLDAQPAAEPRRTEAVRRRRLVQQHRRQWHGSRARAGPPSTSLISRAAAAASLPAVCAIPSAWPGSLKQARYGRWSTSATAWATRRLRTI